MHGTRQCTAIQISRYNSLRNSSAHFQYCNWSHRYQISLATALQAPPFSAKHLRCGLEMAPVLRKLPRLGGEFQFSVCLSLWRVASIPDSLCTSIQLGWPAHVSTSPELETRNPRNPSPKPGTQEYQTVSGRFRREAPAAKAAVPARTFQDFGRHFKVLSGYLKCISLRLWVKVCRVEGSRALISSLGCKLQRCLGRTGTVSRYVQDFLHPRNPSHSFHLT